MPIPPYDQMMRPLLELATQQEISRQNGTAAMSEYFKLTDEERAARIPSGASTFVRNRVGWAMTFLTKAKLIERVAPRVFRATEAGRKFLTDHPGAIHERDLAKLPGWHDAWKSKDKSASEPPKADVEGVTPLEAIDNAVLSLNAELKARLLATILGTC